MTFNPISAPTNINTTTCDNAYSLKAGNITFNKTNPSGQVTLKNKGGCDSLVIVKLNFSTFSLGQFDFETCDQTYSYKVGTETFNKSKPSGSATLIGASAAGCDSIVSVNIVFLPQASFNFVNTTCDVLYNKIIGNKTFDKNTPSGSVTLIGAAKNGCDSVVTVNLTFLPVSKSNFTFATCDDSYFYKVGNETFTKSKPSGSVLLAGAAVNGCDSLVNVVLNFDTFDFTQTILYACDGSDATLNINLASHPGPYMLKIDDVLISDKQILPYTTTVKPGPHKILLETQQGCLDSLIVNVDNSNGPLVDLTQTPSADGKVQLNVITQPNVLYDIFWSPGATLSCIDCFDPIANPSLTTTYVFNYTYGKNCLDSREITVVKINVDIILPNIFSPSGDNSNETFFVQLPDGVGGIVKKMRIYNRWGNLLFNKENVAANVPAEGWKGDMNGTIVNPGVYVYVIEMQIDGMTNVKVYSGDITIVK
ncbi:MAG: gliding motility-associated C-terminal domain-containing protein [Saprospiraceae bacterium]|nr:gliding motility-associated C-terminal domain-containing protein [Saprospiraceae bacterium]